MKQFLLLLIIYLSISFAMQYLLPADELLLDSLSQTISVNKAEEVLAQLVKIPLGGLCAFTCAAVAKMAFGCWPAVHRPVFC
jgi:hypothetical protein